MPKRLSIVALLAAWLCASGAMLDVVQVFAWAKMFTRYAHAMPLAEAAVETMDANKPCPLCLALRRAREESKEQQPATESAATEKLILAFHDVQPIVLIREREQWPRIAARVPDSRPRVVSVPPPRGPRSSSIV